MAGDSQQSNSELENEQSLLPVPFSPQHTPCVTSCGNSRVCLGRSVSWGLGGSLWGLLWDEAHGK